MSWLIPAIYAYARLPYREADSCQTFEPSKVVASLQPCEAIYERLVIPVILTLR